MDYDKQWVGEHHPASSDHNTLSRYKAKTNTSSKIEEVVEPKYDVHKVKELTYNPYSNLEHIFNFFGP